MAESIQKATFGAGCFWHPQDHFDVLDGVKETMVGFSGGHVEEPSYENVCAGETGHTEVVHVTYDESLISYEELLKVFFEIHDPTQMNRQGPDIGYQYRSVIFYHTDKQKEIAEKFIKELEESGTYKKPIVTALEPFSNFYKAEEYHQFYNKKQRGEL